MNQSAQMPARHRFETAEYLPRAIAALLDGLVLYAIFVAIERVWISSRDYAQSLTVKPLPTAAVIVAVACLALYVLITGALGRTLGMLAVDLRIARSDGSTADRPRLLFRAVLLVAVLGVLWWIEPLLLLAYPLWMLFNDRHLMLHDQLSDTAVHWRSSASMTDQAVDNARAHLGALEPSAARALLGELDQLRRHALADIRTAAPPILVLGLLGLGGMAANRLSNEGGESFAAGYYFWALAGPVGLAVTALSFRRQQRRNGVGTGVLSMVIITILVACAALVTARYSLGGLVAGVGFLAVAVVQRSRLLAAAAVAFSLVNGLEPARAALSGLVESGGQAAGSTFYFGQFDNEFDFLAPGVLGLILLGTGAVALRRDRVR